MEMALLHLPDRFAVPVEFIFTLTMCYRYYPSNSGTTCVLSEIGDECLTDVHCDAAVNNRYTRRYYLRCILFGGNFIDRSEKLAISIKPQRTVMIKDERLLVGGDAKNFLKNPMKNSKEILVLWGPYNRGPTLDTPLRVRHHSLLIVC